MLKILNLAEDLGVDQWSLSHHYYYFKDIKNKQDIFTKKHNLKNDIWGEYIGNSKSFLTEKERKSLNKKIMGKVVINSYEDFEKLVGQQIGISDYVELTQERINLFADATLDHQWIHVDPERAKVESPFHSTIAHGYLTLSLLPHLWNQIIEVNNLKMMINYGMDKMKFGQPVLTGQSIRLIAKLQTLTNLRGVAKAEIKFAIEIKDQPKKALEGVAIFLYYFN